MKKFSSPSRFLVLFTLGLFALGCDGKGPESIPDPTASPETGSLVWSDEFGGTSLDTTKWNFETGYGSDGWGNQEWQNYTSNPENVYLEDGKLVISARCDSGTPAYQDGSVTSARITTKDKFEFRYGKIQARIKTPSGVGMWPAFWMLGANFPATPWPKCGEIDIMEMHYKYSDIYTTHAAVHWFVDGPDYNTYFTDEISFADPLTDDYHVYEVEWDQDRIIGRIDGQLYFLKFIDPVTMSEFLEDFFIILNVAVGGTLGGDVITSTWPQNMYVDWVRVYSATEGGGGGVGELTEPMVGIYTDNPLHAVQKLPYSRIINSYDWQPANSANANPDSTATDPLDGSIVISADFTVEAGNTWGGFIFDFGGVDISDYSTLVFSIDTTDFPNFDDMKVAFEDSSTGKTELELSSYTPTNVVGTDWYTYEIPLSDFAAANLGSIKYLIFLNPVDSGDNLIAGTLHVDDIYISKHCVKPGRVRFNGTTYAADGVGAEIMVLDECAADSQAIATLVNGLETIDIEVAVDSTGEGTAAAAFGPTDDATDTILVAGGDTLTVNYTDVSSTVRTDTADIIATGPVPLEGDDNDDGLVYFYASDPATVIDWQIGVDYTAVDDWSSGATQDNNYTADTTFGPDPVFSIIPGNGWAPTVWAGALAIQGLSEDFSWNHTNLKFKFKGTAYTSVAVKFPGAKLVEELAFQVADADSLGGDWYEFTVPLADFGALYDVTEFAILNYGASEFFLTDIYFE